MAFLRCWTAALLLVSALGQQDNDASRAPSKAPLLPAARSSPHLIFMNSSEGVSLLKEASHVQPYWNLTSEFVTETPGDCGPASAVVVMNALASQGFERPVSTEYSIAFHGFSKTYYYWEQKNIWTAPNVSCLDIVPWRGSLEQVGRLMSCRGLAVQVVRASDSSADTFRAALKNAFAKQPNDFVVINFDRQAMGQAGMGHHSPIGAYDEATDRVLVMDVARYRFPPWWAKVEDIFNAMVVKGSTPFPGFDTPRGFLVVGMPSVAPSKSVMDFVV